MRLIPKASVSMNVVLQVTKRLGASFVAFVFVCAIQVAVVAQDLTGTIVDAQMRCVKVYGAGGPEGLEAYQSGFFVSPQGHVATVWSYVLDAEPLIVLDDGRRMKGQVVGFEPKLELAVIKIEGEGYPYFSLQDIPQPNTGDAVLGFSNAFGVATGPEPVTVMFGHLSAKSTLAGRRGYFKTPYEGSIYVLDLIANNPGAAGGALTDLSGRLLGMLGKELRDDRTGAWLNYAVPGEVLKPILRDIVAGKAPDVMPPQKRALPADRAQQLELLGIVLVPNVLDRTPAFIDQIKPESAAAKAGILADDLIVLVGDTRIDSQTTLKDLLARTDRQDRLSVVVQRGSQLLTLNISP